MTRRERLERKLERRAEWAAARQRRATQAFAQGDPYRGDVAFYTQPGHIPERARVLRAFERGCEELSMAQHHTAKAAGLGAQLDRAVFSDDPDAIQAIEARIADLEAKRARMVLVNKLYRKGDAAGLAALGLDLDTLKTKLAEAGPYWGKAPHLPYEMSNLSGRIGADKKRLDFIRAQQARQAEAEAAPAGVVIEGGDWVRVTFAEKPDRSVLTALKAAGFVWRGGSWIGQRVNLPAEVSA